MFSAVQCCLSRGLVCVCHVECWLLCILGLKRVVAHACVLKPVRLRAQNLDSLKPWVSGQWVGVRHTTPNYRFEKLHIVE